MSTAKVQEQFTRQAHRYARSRPHASGASLAALIDLARPRAGERALDVATGTGFTAFAVAERGASVVAADLTRGMLEEARRLAAERGLAGVRFVEAAAEALPFPSRTFELVTCRIAPHHFASIPAFLSEVRRILRPGGRLALADTTTFEDPEVDRWHQDVETIRDPTHGRNCTPSEWRRLAEAAGFTVETLSADERTDHSLSDWLRTSGSPPDAAAEVRRRFAEASTAVRSAFEIRDADGDVRFRWPCVTLLAYSK